MKQKFTFYLYSLIIQITRRTENRPLIKIVVDTIMCLYAIWNYSLDFSCKSCLKTIGHKLIVFSLIIVRYKLQIIQIFAENPSFLYLNEVKYHCYLTLILKIHLMPSKIDVVYQWCALLMIWWNLFCMIMCWNF